MDQKSTLYIVIGPNGAGKSTFGELYTEGVRMYDPDKRKSQIEHYLSRLGVNGIKKLYPLYSIDLIQDQFDELVDDYKNREYIESRNQCVSQSLDFALETPFADNFGLNEVLYFRENGYFVKGILFGLETVEESIANVNLRINKKEGHDLYLKSIRWNFEHCYLNICNNIHLFDSLTFIHAFSVAEVPTPFACYSNGQMEFFMKNCNIPKWFSLFDRK